MSEFYLHYSSVEDSITQSEKARGKISDYISEIKNKITVPIGNLSGNDTAGYTSTAENLAWKKIGELEAKTTRFSSYEKSVSSFISTAKEKDTQVASRIESLANLAIGERTWIQHAEDWLYNTFCVDIANSFEWTRNIVDFVKYVDSEWDNLVEGVEDWFKYGEGKYWLNILGAVAAVCVSAAATIVAIAAAPFTGGLSLAAVVGFIGVVASCVSTIIVMINAESQISGNAKAISLDREGKSGAARYYGNITKKSEEWQKTDMGDSEANDFYETAGKVIDTTKVVVDVTAFTCNAFNSATAVRDYRFTKNVSKQLTGRYEYTLKNVLHNIKGEFGLYLTKPGIQLKNAKKFEETFVNVVNGIKFYNDSGISIFDIWSKDGSSVSKNSSVVEDPFGEIESDLSDISGLFDAYETAMSSIQ